MDLSFGPQYEELRREVEAFCKRTWPAPGASERERAVAWRKQAIAAGYLSRTVPKQYGGAGLAPDILAETVIRRAFEASGVPYRASAQGTHMLVPTLLECGSEEQRQAYIAKTLTGELNWCQGYSEPGSGSDLASLKSSAVLRGDEWVINGQKIWTSNATVADMMFGLFRTEPDAPKHAGISYLLLDMRTPGIDVRPLRMMQGGEDFCEVFFTDVRVPAKNIVGKRGEGWNVSRATLKHERMLIGDSAGAQLSFAGLVELARRTTRGGKPATQDPLVRQRLAEIEGYLAAQEYAAARMLTAIAKNRDATVHAEMLTGKLMATNIGQMIAKLAMDLLGERGLAEPNPDEAEMGIRRFTDGRWVSQYMMSISTAIAGGASNIQRNIIGERLLGLPRDQRPPGH
jgi:alkylation response protein AidB-like acyl-CoA dehydrogenase